MRQVVTADRRPLVGAVPPRAAEPLLRTVTGRVLRRTRTAAGRTLQDVATQARISIAYLSEVERGRKEASSEVLVAVCRSLGIRLVDLLTQVTADLLAAELTTDLAARRRAAASPRAGVELTSVPDDGRDGAHPRSASGASGARLSVA